jgi:hypothetical protein
VLLLRELRADLDVRDAGWYADMLLTPLNFRASRCAACGGNKAEAAKRLHMRRQSLYYRLDQIANLLDVDLDDPKQLVTLAVAVTARRMLSAGR